MPPPPNTTFGTAIDLGTLPADIVADASDGAGTNYDLYYKFTAPANSRVIGAWGFTPIPDAFATEISPYLGPAGAPTWILSIATTNKPIQFPVTPASEYFLKFAKNGNSQPATVRVRVEVAPLNTPVSGNILVNDDTNNFPAVILSHLADHTVINFIKDMAAGEGGDTFSNGVIVLEKFADNTIRVYNNSFSEIANIAHSAGDPRIRTCIGQNKIFVGVNRNPCELFTILPDGSSTAPQTMTGVTSMLGCAASNDGTILYYSLLSSGAALKRWDIIGNTGLTDLVAGVAGEYIVDILVLNDNSIIALSEVFLSNIVNVRRYNSSGTLLRTYNFTNSEPAGTFARLAYPNPLASSSSFWVWTHTSNGISHFWNINTETGAVITERQFIQYESGIYNATETETPLSRFGNSFSCPFIILQALPPLGLFKIVPDKRTDHDGTNTVAIPNPTFKTGLMP